MNQQSHLPTGQPLQRPATANERPGAFSFRNLRSIVNAPMGRTPAGEVISKLQKALELTYVNIGKDFEVTVLPMDYNQNPVLSISALVVCVRSRTNPDLGVGYHTLILEGSIEPLQARIEQVNGQQVRVQRVAGDANNARMIDAVANEVSRAFPTSRIYNADNCVVPADFDLTSEDLVYALASNAAELVERVNQRLAYGSLPAALKTEITTAVASITIRTNTQANTDADRRARVNAAVLLTLVSPEFLVQR